MPAPVHYVSAATTIRAPRQDVWEFIKPPENSVLLDPQVIRGFRAPSLEGAPELQVFISMRDGVETVSAIEVLQEVPGELAITRTLGDPDPAKRGRDFLADADGGGTLLEHGLYFTLPAEARGRFRHYEQHYRLHCQQYVERVKSAMERA
jgi:hypothetical protein